LRNTMGANLLNVIFLGYGKCEWAVMAMRM
jgi:hypothetical protein